MLNLNNLQESSSIIRVHIFIVKYLPYYEISKKSDCHHDKANISFYDDYFEKMGQPGLFRFFSSFSQYNDK